MALIDDINTTLQPLEETKIQGFDKIDYPVMFIVAPPRSGTTLLYQLLSLHYDLFYPSNVLAKFYKAPYLFAKMTIDLELESSRVSSLFTSEFGNTKGGLEPHEWGWFWERFFMQGEKNLVNELAALQSLYPKPMLFKTIYFNYYCETILFSIPDAVFLRIERNEVDTIQSIYQAINKRGRPIGSKEHAEYYEALMGNKIELAVIEYLYDTMLLDEKLPSESTINVNYDDLLEDVQKTLYGVIEEVYRITKRRMVRRETVIKNLSEKAKAGGACQDLIHRYLDKYRSFSLNDLEKELFGKENER